MMKFWKNVDFTDYNFIIRDVKDEKLCYNIFVLDIETTSYFITPDNKVISYDRAKEQKYYEKCLKGGIVYEWTFSIDDRIIYGRHWEDYEIFIEKLSNYISAKMLIFVHNLSFEFQWLRNFFCNDVEVFARNVRKPMYFRRKTREYRCTYFLTRMSLESWAINKHLPVTKAIGDLDYNVLRTPYTKMSKEELVYCERDVMVVYHGIKQFLETYKNVWDIPLTQTGIVRREFNKCLYRDIKLHKHMAELVPKDLELYRLLLQAFWGGIAHSSFKYQNELIKDMRSRDKKSSYPWVMLYYKYPSSPFVKVDPKIIYFGNDKYSYLITVELFEVTCKLSHSYISASKCSKLLNGEYDNGRVLYADYVCITCTNVDYEIILDSYDVKKKNIIDFRVSVNKYLPNDICKFILKWFTSKTLLDGVAGEEKNYALSKEFLNAIFGMMVTRIITDDIYFTDSWKCERLTQARFDELVEKQLKNFSKLNNAFQWGVWVTAYGRKDLWESVVAVGDDNVYLDTDSNKYLWHHNLHESWFDEYNRKILERHEEVAKRIGVDPSELHPTSPSGKKCVLGSWEVDCEYSEFKTLGAKKYCYKERGSDEIHITVSGVRKEASKQLKSVDEFSDNFVFDIDNAKKNIAQYIDKTPYVVVNRGKYDEYVSMIKYSINIMPTTYKLSRSEDYVKLFFEYAAMKSKELSVADFIEGLVKKHGKRRAL